jgi:methyl-accepting chemotaxis protein
VEERRKKLLVDKRIQLRYMKTIILLLVFFSIAMGISNYFLTSLVLRASQLVPNAEKYLNQLFKGIAYLVTVETIVFIIIAAIISIITSNHFAGPISRIREAMNAVRAGNLDYRIKIRKGDDLIDVVGEFNNMLDGIQKKNKPTSL